MDGYGFLLLVGVGGFAGWGGWILSITDRRRHVPVTTHTEFFERVIGELRKTVLHYVPELRVVRNRSEHTRHGSEDLKQMPEMLDILTLGLSAGLSFDASLELYCNRSTTRLARALRAAMESWRMGVRTRDEALRSLADEYDLAALRRFSDAVSQSLAFGSPLAKVLEQQAQSIRDEQRSQVEEQIEKAPVKMLIPLGTLIVPAMLLSILGPLLGGAVGLG